MASTRVLNTPELLCHIFEGCLPDLDFLRHTPLDAPLVLTQVSARWREVAVSNSRLWTRFHLKCNKRTFEENGGDNFPALREWLRRSIQRPFFLKITYEDPDYVLWRWDFVVPSTGSLNRLLFEHRNRWEVLDIDMPSTSSVFFRNAPDSPGFPQLKELTIHDDLCVGGTPFRIVDVPRLEILRLAGEEPETNDFFLDVNMPPSVRHLSLRLMTLLLGIPRPTNITKIEFHDAVISLGDFANFPKFFPLLEELLVSFCTDTPSHGFHESFVVFQNLHSLESDTLHGFPMVYMTSPNLKDLSITGSHFEPDMLTFPDVLSFLKRSTPPLQVFRNNGMTMTHEDFVALLDLVPNLNELEIVNTRISATSLMALALPINTESTENMKFRCPALWSLELDCVTEAESADTEPSSAVPDPKLVHSLLMTRCVADPSPTHIVNRLEYVGLPLGMDELERLKIDCPRMHPGTKLYSTLRFI